MQAHIIIIHLNLVTGSAARNESDHALSLLRFHTHDFSNLFPNLSAAYRTGVDRGLARRYGRSQPRTAGISAAAAVISGQLCKDSLFFFIYLYLEKDGGPSEEKADKQPHTAYDCRSNQNT